MALLMAYLYLALEQPIQVGPGLEIQAIYQVADPLPGGLGQPPWDMDIDPLTGRVYIAQTTQQGGNILWIDLNQGTAGTLPFFSQGLGFAPDGTLYFGVSNFILGTWQRDSGIYLKFAIIPSVRGVDVTSGGDLFVAESSFGPQGLYPDTILSVDRGDGFFEPVWSTDEAEQQTGIPLNVLTSFAIGDDQTIYAGYHTGELVIKSPSGPYQLVNLRGATIGGLNEFPVEVDQNGVLYQYDVSTGQIFAITKSGEISLLAFGDAIRGHRFSNGAIVSDGFHIYLVADYQVLYQIKPTQSASILAAITEPRPSVPVQFIIQDQFTKELLADVRIKRQGGLEQLTDDSGSSTLDLAEGLYEFLISKPGYRTLAINIVVEGDEGIQFRLELNPGLPDIVAPGLVADILANNTQDGINGSSDVAIDLNGNVYSMNFKNGAISHHRLNQDTRELEQSRIVATGGGLANSFIVSVDAQFNLYASIGNDGVMVLPFDPQATYQLLNDPQDAAIVRDQLGINRSLSLIRDVDGIAASPSGDLFFSSGAGGAPTANFPNGTFNSVVQRHMDGNESIFSRGIPSGGGDPLFSNNDITKLDNQNRLLVGTRTGDVVRVNHDGSAELIWPGDGKDKPDGLGAFSCINSDGSGHLFVRGDNGDGTSSMLRMISPDGEQLFTVCAGLTQCFGGFEFDEDGRSVIIGDDNNLVRIRSLDGRSIAENLLFPAPRAEMQKIQEFRVIRDSHHHNGR